MGRPAQLSGPVVAIAVDGKTAAWCDGHFVGDRQIVKIARRAAEHSDQVSWGRLPADETAGDTTPRAALAALMAYDPERTCITEWPDSVRTWWERSTVRCMADRIDEED